MGSHSKNGGNGFTAQPLNHNIRIPEPGLVAPFNSIDVL